MTTKQDDLDKQNKQNTPHESDSGASSQELSFNARDAMTAPTDETDRYTAAQRSVSGQATSTSTASTTSTANTVGRARMTRVEREAEQQAEYERHPFQWEDTAWLIEPQLLEATLTLPAEGYRAWISRHEMYGAVGVEPSAYENPVSEYLGKVMGVQPELQTDGQHAWFMLQLTKALRNTEPRYLRVVLPAWVTPLALEYTSFPVGRTSGRPQPKEVSAYDAYRLLERVLSDITSGAKEQ